MLFSLARLVWEAAQYFTWEPGDVLFTGTPAGVGPVQRGEVLEAYFDDVLAGQVYVT
jgi:2-keto-4-pentenoate hydratase/2-oxohepta-3-ene-1,7-dioic acid hydratase in catechol pathway